MGRRAIIIEAIWIALIGSCVLPLWIVEHPPIQDLPQHLAAIRVLHSHGDPSFGLAKYFTVDLFRTQYIAYYALADLLSYPLGVALANRVLLTLSLVALPYAMRTVLRQLGSNEELATLSLPLLYNAHLVLGFLNFLAAIPLCLFGLALALRDRERPMRSTAVGLAVLLVVTFYMHVIPFALLALGVALIHLQRDLRALLRGLFPLVPALVAAIVWLIGSPAGQATVGAARGDRGHTLGPVFRSVEQAWATVPMWMTDVLRSDADDRLHVYVTWLVLSAFSFGLGLAWTGALPRVRVAYRLLVLPLSCVLAYLVLPESYDWIWPIAPRFPLLALLLLLAVVPRLPMWIARGVALVAVVLALGQTKAVADAFVAFDRDEVGELDAALGVIPPAQRVAGLIFDRGSRHVKFSPFIHAVAYYQAEKGGAVMFTFADFPQSPFRFRDDQRPPPVGPRWEWMPERVTPARDLAWYDYVLVRGGPGRIARDAARFQPVFRGPHWSVWRRL